MALLLTQLALELAGRSTRTVVYEGPAAEPVPSAEVARRTLEIILWIVGFFAAIWLLGFSTSVPAMTVLYLLVAGRERWPLALAGGAVSWLLFYAVFERVLHIQFPPPAVLSWLG